MLKPQLTIVQNHELRDVFCALDGERTPYILTGAEAMSALVKLYCGQSVERTRSLVCFRIEPSR